MKRSIKKDRIRKGQFGVKMGTITIVPKIRRKPKHQEQEEE